MLQKTIATCFVFLFILCNNSFAQISSGTFSDNSKPEIVWQDNGIGTINQITSVNGDQYGIRSTQVYKLDSSGHTVWIRDFSQPINPASPFPNSFGGLAVRNGRIFIQELQGPPSSGAGGNYFPAIIVMDTSGQILNTTYYNTQYLGFNMIGCFRAATTGAWFIYNISTGMSSHVFFLKTDSIGNWDLTAHSPELEYLSRVELKQICTLSDSTFLAFSNGISINFNQFPEYIACAKFNDQGTFLWHYSFYDNTFTGTIHTTTLETATVDSSGNIYMIGNYTKTPSPSPVDCRIKIKADKDGTVRSCRYWTQLPPGVGRFTNLAFHDTSMSALVLYNSGSGANYTRIDMDSAFNSPCLGQDSAIDLFNSGALSRYGSGMNSPISVSYIPGIDTGQITISPPLIYPDFCNLVNGVPISIESHENDFIIYPNPVNTTLNLVSTEQSGTLIKLELFTLTGMLVLDKKCIQEKTISVDVTQFRSGFYILKIETDKRNVYRKIYIQSDN